MTANTLASVLDRVDVGPSNLFPGGVTFEVAPKPAGEKPSPLTGHFVRLRFSRPDTHTGEIGKGYSRWEFVPQDATPDAIIKTAFVLMKLTIEHELLEAFLVDNVCVFDPHQTIAQLQKGATSKS